ncbi:MAG: DUF4111 domain-containing protein [Cyanosarcina radialis HA8281-LM2]|jgi:hypothetical protein|nr:DUF4111 domain-containing protein [Cyanosarcina radialis HA8281-LM2]
MNAKIPEAIYPLLDDYMQLLDRSVPDLAEAFYLHGSIALGAFNERMSDIDFIAVLRRRPTPQDITHLKTSHQILLARYPKWKLDGSYLQWNDLGCLPDAIAPSPYVADGVFHLEGYRDINLVTWWVLKHHGIALLGPSPQTLTFTVSWDELVARLHDNLNTYWQSWTRSPIQLPKLLSDYSVQWAVLGVLRLWYSFCEGDITSKTGAGIYALSHLPERWHPIVREALALREGCGQIYTSRIRRAYDAVEFLRYIIRAYNDRLQTNSCYIESG